MVPSILHFFAKIVVDLCFAQKHNGLWNLVSGNAMFCRLEWWLTLRTFSLVNEQYIYLSLSLSVREVCDGGLLF